MAESAIAAKAFIAGIKAHIKIDSRIFIRIIVSLTKPYFNSLIASDTPILPAFGTGVGAGQDASSGDSPGVPSSAPHPPSFPSSPSRPPPIMPCKSQFPAAPPAPLFPLNPRFPKSPTFPMLPLVVLTMIFLSNWSAMAGE